MTALLEIGAVGRAFGGVYAVRDVAMTVAEGETRAVIGPNGAGKSTLFNLISSVAPRATGVSSTPSARIDRKARAPAAARSSSPWSSTSTIWYPAADKVCSTPAASSA